MAAAPEAKKKIGVEDFEFGKLLGEGSFGDVLLCTHKASGRQFAAKKIEKTHLVKTGNTKYAVLEREVLTSCNHPNIIKLSFSFRDDACLYYILELAPNGELRKVIKKNGNFNLETARFYAAELVAVLEYLHEKARIIHRDLKPENVLMSETMHVKLTDFGTARKLKEGETRVRTASFLGTAEYIAPECLAEEPEVSRSSDLWALGCIIYQMLTGQYPFHGDTQFLTFEQVKSGDVKFPSRFPYQAKDLIKRLLTLNPEERLGTSSYAELKEHPFFEGVDWENLATTTPPPIQSNPEYTFDNINAPTFRELLSGPEEKVLEFGTVKYLGKEGKKTSGILVLTSSHLRFLNKAGTSERKSYQILPGQSKMSYSESGNEITCTCDKDEEIWFRDTSEFDPARWRRALRKAAKAK